MMTYKETFLTSTQLFNAIQYNSSDTEDCSTFPKSHVIEMQFIEIELYRRAVFEQRAVKFLSPTLLIFFSMATFSITFLIEYLLSKNNVAV